MRNKRIAIIDSGISMKVNFADRIIASYVLHDDEVSVTLEETSEDYIGHGTAVANIIHDTNPNIDFISFRVCNDEMVIDEKGLICILQYVYDCIDVDLINISAGLVYIYDYDGLKNICKKLYEDRGIIIISAFDNDGAISYPAALDEVIGVDVKRDYVNKNDIYYIENSIVDILMPDIFYRTLWNEKRTILRGTSFATARVTGLISRYIDSDSCVNKYVLVETISNMKRITPINEPISSPQFAPRKVIVFPVNKESKALLRYQDMLSFDIVGVYDERVSGNIGQVMYGKQVKAFDDIDWELDFDTVVLSCTDELTRITKRRYSEEIVYLAQKKDKYIYTFEELESDYKKIFYPKISPSMTIRKNNYKLNKTTLPIVGIFGTSSRQGKFSLQLEIINYLKQVGYNVGHIATEPSGYLFGADFVYHFGYHSYLKVQAWESVTILNNMIWEIQTKEKDILVTGCQSGTLHYRDSSVEDFAIFQYAFLLGTLPDFIVLCVNPHDELDYIGRTIDFINSVGDGKVCALVIFPIRAVESVSGVKYRREQLSYDAIVDCKKTMNDAFKVPIYELGNQEDLDVLCNQIISYF